MIQHLQAMLSGDLGLAFVIANVLLDQIGLPVPAVPTLIMAGALAAGSWLVTGELFLGAAAACVIPDIGWYLAGRWYGSRVMKALCRISLNPDSCVNETQLRFERWGPGAIVIAKFVPGLAIIAPPLAGATGMSFPRFLLLSGLSAMLWVGAALSVGMLLRPEIARLLPQLNRVTSLAAALIGILLGLYIAFKWAQRRRFFKTLRMARISVKELYELIQAGAAPVIVDVRSATARALEPRRVPGALCITLQEVSQQLAHLPRDRDIVLYCSCPNEASAARAAQILIRNGFERVRPLGGGLDAWIAAGFAAEAPPPAPVRAALSSVHP